MSWTDMDLKTFAAGLALGGRFGGTGAAGFSGIARDVQIMAMAGRGGKIVSGQDFEAAAMVARPSFMAENWKES